MNKVIFKDLKYATEDKIKELLEESQGEITGNNLEALGELIDIHKDIANEEYWCEKEEGEGMRYGHYDYDHRDYDRYGRDEYGTRRRDSRGRYRGHDYLDDMYDYYGRYMESRGRYGDSEDKNMSYHYMVKALEDFIKVLEEEAESTEQKQMLHQALQNAMR